MSNRASNYPPRGSNELACLLECSKIAQLTFWLAALAANHEIQIPPLQGLRPARRSSRYRPRFDKRSERDTARNQAVFVCLAFETFAPSETREARKCAGCSPTRRCCGETQRHFAVRRRLRNSRTKECRANGAPATLEPDAHSKSPTPATFQTVSDRWSFPTASKDSRSMPRRAMRTATSCRSFIPGPRLLVEADAYSPGQLRNARLMDCPQEGPADGGP